MWMKLLATAIFVASLPVGGNLLWRSWNDEREETGSLPTREVDTVQWPLLRDVQRALARAGARRPATASSEAGRHAAPSTTTGPDSAIHVVGESR